MSEIEQTAAKLLTIYGRTFCSPILKGEALPVLTDACQNCTKFGDNIWASSMLTHVFRFQIKWKTENQLKIHFVHLFADENEHIDDLVVVVLGQKRLKN